MLWATRHPGLIFTRSFRIPRCLFMFMLVHLLRLSFPWTAMIGNHTHLQPHRWPLYQDLGWQPDGLTNKPEPARMSCEASPPDTIGADRPQRTVPRDLRAK